MRVHALHVRVAVTALVCATSSARAEPSAADRETSRALYSQGMQALDAHDYSTAERTCGGAHSLVKAPTSAACWGRALEGLGRLVEARDVFLEALRFPVSRDEPTVFGSARDAARVEADQLSKRIPSVTLIVSGPPTSAPLHVTIDGANLPSDTARLPRKVNPGSRSIAVTARGFEPATVDVQIAEAEDRHVEIALQPASKVTPVGPGPKQVPAAPPPPLALVAGGIGALGIGVGIVAGLAAGSKHSTLAGECTTAGGTCPPSAQGDLDSFHTLRAVSAVGYVVGAIGIVGGAALWLLAPTQASDVSARLWVAPGTAGLVGAF